MADLGKGDIRYPRRILPEQWLKPDLDLEVGDDDRKPEENENQHGQMTRARELSTMLICFIIFFPVECKHLKHQDFISFCLVVYP